MLAAPDRLCSLIDTIGDVRVERFIAHPWIRDAEKSQIASFVRGILQDKAAVRAAIKEPWSTDQTEGQVNRLKLTKRQMCGRAKVDLIEAGLRGAA